MNSRSLCSKPLLCPSVVWECHLIKISRSKKKVIVILKTWLKLSFLIFVFCRLDIVDLYYKKEFIQVNRLVGLVWYFCLICCMVLETIIVDDSFCLRTLFDIISYWVNISSKSEALRQTCSENILEWLAKYFFLKKLFKTSVRKFFFLTYQGRFL